MRLEVRRLGLGLALAAAALVAACGVPKNEVGSTTAVPASSVTASTVALDGDKALYAATAAYNGAGIAIHAAVQAGALKGPSAANVKVYYDQAYSALQAARAAHAIGNTILEQQNATQALALLGEVTKLTPVYAQGPAG